MASIVLDADILRADSIGLARIQAQQDRNTLEGIKQQTLREKVVLAIADKYMTTGTATDPAAVLADAQKDAARLRAAVDEVLKVMLP